MTWHLKDRELEKVFEAYSGGKFVKSLNYAVEQEIIDSECVVYVGFGREFLGPDFAENCLCFRTDELEEVCEYNPKAWNDSRKVTPPEDVVFRVKVHRARKDDGETVLYECLIFRRSVWYRVINGKPLGIQFSLYEGDYVEFKSWEG